MFRPRRVIRRLYQRLVPLAFRKSRWTSRLRGCLLSHDEIYNWDFYANTVDGQAIASAGVISDSIVSDLKPRTVVDIGCGTGALLEELRKRGCEVFGLEYSEAGLNYCRARQINVLKFDLERDVFKDFTTFDIAISMEVAEHLPEKAADRYVNLLTRLSAIVVFTAAQLGQGGADHVNEQPSSYWISKFQNRDFEFDEELTQCWRVRWKSAGVFSCYRDNLMIFRRIR